MPQIIHFLWDFLRCSGVAFTTSSQTLINTFIDLSQKGAMCNYICLQRSNTSSKTRAAESFPTFWLHGDWLLNACNAMWHFVSKLGRNQFVLTTLAAVRAHWLLQITPLGLLFATVRNKNLSFHMALSVAALSWDTHHAEVTGIKPPELMWLPPHCKMSSMPFSCQTPAWHCRPVVSQDLQCRFCNNSSWGLADGRLPRCTVKTNSHNTGHSLPQIRQAARRGNHTRL